MLKLQPQSLDFKIRINVRTYQTWAYKRGESQYTLYMTWCDSRQAWEIDLQKTNGGVITTLIHNMMVTDNVELANVLRMSDYPPVHEKNEMCV